MPLDDRVSLLLRLLSIRSWRLWERRLRHLLTWAAFGALALFYMVPVAGVQVGGGNRGGKQHSSLYRARHQVFSTAVPTALTPSPTLCPSAVAAVPQQPDGLAWRRPGPQCAADGGAARPGAAPLRDAVAGAAVAHAASRRQGLGAPAQIRNAFFLGSVQLVSSCVAVFAPSPTGATNESEVDLGVVRQLFIFQAREWGTAWLGWAGQSICASSCQP